MEDSSVCSVKHNCLVSQTTAKLLLRAITPLQTLRYGCDNTNKFCDRISVSQALIDDGTDVKNPSASELTPLHEAARDGTLETVEMSTRRTRFAVTEPVVLGTQLAAAVNAVDNHGCTLLHLVACLGRSLAAAVSQ